MGLSGDTAVVGAVDDDTDAGTDAGSAYVFSRAGTTWTEQSKLEASDGAPFDLFGAAVAADGETAVIGAYQTDAGAVEDAGSAYVFSRVGTTWTEQSKLQGDETSGDNFGFSVALDGDTAAVGAVFADSAAGSAYVFSRVGTTWTAQPKLTASDPEPFVEFGYAVAVDGGTLIVGVYRDNTATGGLGAGSAYVFVDPSFVAPTTTSSTTTTLAPTTTTICLSQGRICPTTTIQGATTTTIKVGQNACGNPTISGTAGNDTIVGTAGADVIDGRGGNDQITGLGGNDRICGSEGDDRLDGGQGNDFLNGGPGFDSCIGGPGTDKAATCESIASIP